jgi:hypothetical protein
MPSRRRRTPLVLLLALFAGCSAPRAEDCELRCGAGGRCPEGLVCGADDLCYRSAAGAPATPPCSERPDGGPDPDPDRPDAAAAACAELASACDVHRQCGCAAEEACDLDVAMPFCRPVTRAGAPGDPCDAIEQCAAGLTCTRGTCHRFCDGNVDCADLGGQCALRYAGTENRVCSMACDPLDPATCAEGFTCQLFSQTGFGGPDATDVSDCRRAGAGTTGDACGDSGCAQGYGCVEFALGGDECRAWCDLGTPACAAGTTCEPFSDGPLRVDGRSWGTCAPDPE